MIKTMKFFKIIQIIRKIKNFDNIIKNKIWKNRCPTISKKEFIKDIKKAVEYNTGYAAGKIGASEQYLMYYPIFLKKKSKNKKFEKELIRHALKQEGVFPANLNFCLDYSKFYIDHIKNLDCLGIFYYHNEEEMIKFYKLKNKLISSINQEPDRSIPNDKKNCYLHCFKDKKILLICPFAKFLKKRANKETFEKVWSKTEKKWFYPKKIEALEFPYGFDNKTHEKYTNVFNLIEHLKNEIQKKDFDIALIAAAGIAVPLASYIKSIGKIGISLGGHLQILFGVYGKRWEEKKEYQKNYFNENWIKLPNKYKPKQTDVCDDGAYW